MPTTSQHATGGPPGEEVARLVAEMSARLACQATLTAFCTAADAGDFDAIAQLFTEDCVVDLIGTRMLGRSALKEFFAARAVDGPSRRTVHTLCNATVEVAGRDTATATSILVAYALSDGGESTDRIPRRISIVDDKLIRDSSGRWLIADRGASTLAGPS